MASAENFFSPNLPAATPLPVELSVNNRGPVKFPVELEPNSSPELIAICRRALAKRPAERFAIVGELAVAFQEIGEQPQ